MPQSVVDDTPSELLVGSTRHSAIVLGLLPEGLLLAVESDIGESIPHAKLLLDPTRLLVALDKRLDDIRSDTASYNPKLALMAFHRSKEVEQIESPRLPAPSGLDQAKAHAFERALTSELLFIWGPPGTGKTVLIGAIAKAFVDSTRRVLICSNTNTAVDQALDKVLECLNHTSEGVAVRFGTPSPDSGTRVAAAAVTALARQKAASLETKLTSLRRDSLHWTSALWNCRRLTRWPNGWS
jgi:hypothetical protein